MRRRFLAVIAAAVLACAGVGAAVAIAGSGSNVACATTPAHTVAIDGNPVSTTPGDVECATAPTVTVTVTQPATQPATTSTTTTTPPSYLFDDEFNGAAGTKPSSALWGVKTGSSNGSAHWNGWNQISEDGQGDLVITAQKVSGTWQSGFLSGKTSYVGPHDLTVRAKVACGNGAWSAPGWEWQYPYGANAVENDDVEQLGDQPQTTHTTLHSSATVQASYADPTAFTLCSGFHVYESKVYADHADYYVDGILVRTIAPANLAGTWPFTTTPLCANIDLNMGGWGGTIGVTGPVTMLIDYVRVSALS